MTPDRPSETSALSCYPKSRRTKRTAEKQRENPFIKRLAKTPSRIFNRALQKGNVMDLPDLPHYRHSESPRLEKPPLS
jgi:hypothetical protein